MMRTSKPARFAQAALIILVTIVGVPSVAKQDVAVELFYNGVWNDHRADLDGTVSIVINHAAGAEQGGIVPTDGTLRFKNPAGRMNPDNPKGPLYGLIGEKTPIRVKVSGDIRISGRAVKWSPRRSLGGSKYVSWVDVTIGGKVREMGQGEAPVESALRRTIPAETGLVGYWPLEDVGGATWASSALPGGSPLTGVVPSFEAVDNVVGSKPLADMLGNANATLSAPVTMTATGSWTVQAVLSSTVATSSLEWGIVSWTDTGGAAWVLSRTDTNLLLARNGSLVDFAIFVNPADLNGARVVQATATQSGSDLAYTITLDAVTKASGTLPSTTVGAVTQVRLTPRIAGVSGAADIGGLGHVAVFSNVHSATTTLAAMRGHAGEPAGSRFTRLCAELGIAATLVDAGKGTQPMGPQYPDTSLKLFEEIAMTDAGIIHDTRSQEGLTFRTGRSMYNQ